MSLHFLQNPWPAAVSLLLVAGILLFLAARTAKKAFAIAALACLILCGAVFLADALIDSPTEQVQRLLDSLVAAGLRQDPEPIVAAFDANARFGNWDANSLAGNIRREMGIFRAATIRLNGQQFVETDQTVTAKFVLVTSGTYGSHPVHHYPMRLKVGFRKVGAEWKISEVVRYDLVGGDAAPSIPLFQR